MDYLIKKGKNNSCSFFNGFIVSSLARGGGGGMGGGWREDELEDRQ